MLYFPPSLPDTQDAPQPPCAHPQAARGAGEPTGRSHVPTLLLTDLEIQLFLGRLHLRLGMLAVRPVNIVRVFLCKSSSEIYP